MKWIKQGLLYCHKYENGMEAYTTAPYAVPIAGDIFRIYFSARDIESKSYPTYIDIDIFTGMVSAVAEKPLLQPGKTGTFDDAGCILFQIIDTANKRYLYYAGWSLAKAVPFKCFIGLAVADPNNEIFTKYSIAPIISANSYDPYLTGSPWVMVENGVWHMWYLTGVKWEQNGEVPKHYYTITYATSNNGIDWQPSGKICIPFKSAEEYAVARPVVIKQNGIYKMWYSYRATKTHLTYQIGYAESGDGIEWLRKDDEAGIGAADTGWDSEMICYPFVFEHKNKTYMVYNGNGYGKTGIGLAVLKD